MLTYFLASVFGSVQNATNYDGQLVISGVGFVMSESEVIRLHWAVRE